MVNSVTSLTRHPVIGKIMWECFIDGKGSVGDSSEGVGGGGDDS